MGDNKVGDDIVVGGDVTQRKCGLITLLQIVLLLLIVPMRLLTLTLVIPAGMHTGLNGLGLTNEYEDALLSLG